MSRKRNSYPLIENLEITTIAAEGKSLGKYNDMVVFVPMTLPGDVVNVQINNKRRRFMEGYVTEYIKHSPIKCEAKCSHFSNCGGCKWQNLPYEKQLEYKQQQVIDQLERIGKVDVTDIQPIMASGKVYEYRNKLEFTFSDKRWATREEIASGIELPKDGALGFHISGMFDKILQIDHCYLQPSPSNEIRTKIGEFVTNNGYSFYNARTHEGFMRNIVIRTASTGDVMLIVILGYEDTEKREKLLGYIVKEIPQITSLMYIINTKLNDSYSDLEAICYYGKDHIIETMEDLRFKVGAKSFYQTNSEQAYNLYKIAREAAGLSGSEIVYDLYTGTGTIANFVARGCKKVVGVEYVPEAIEDAKINSAINGIDNTVFYAGDMKDVLCDEFIKTNGHPDVIILDPPRAGLHEDVTETVLRAAPEKIVYVSCNPATQARDIALMAEQYSVVMVQPVDMFPHTHHVENVVLLVKKS